MTDDRTYIKLHDGMPDHPKVDGLSDAAFRLLITMWCYSSRHLTDGVIREATWTKRGTPKARAELLAAGLAEISSDGVVMHDYLEHQRSADEVAVLREKRRAAGSKGGKAKANAIALAKQTGGKSVPESETDRTKQSLVQPRSRGTRIPDGWKPSTSDIDWQRSKGIDDLLARRETEKFINHFAAAAGQRGVKLDWSRTWQNWMLTALERSGQVRPITKSEGGGW